MRFIVDLFRVVILAGIALALVAGSYLIFTVLLSEQSTVALDAATVFAGVTVAVLFILSLGILATIISAHDRLATISDQLVRIGDALEADRVAAQPEQGK